MIIANVRVNLSSAESLSCASIPKNAVGLKVRFQYADPLWNKLSKTAVFRNGTRTVNSVLNEDCAVIPHELLSKTKDTIYVGLYGTDSNRALAIPTVWAKLGEVSSAANPSASVTAETTLPYWAQLQEKVDCLEQEMMVQEDLDRALLQAKESGAFDGPQGPKGEQGNRGEIGPAGYTPIRGTDYWTANDKEAIIAEAANVAAHAIQHSSDIICTAIVSHICLNDASNRELHGLKLYGKTIQNGIPTPAAPVELETAGADGNITINIGTSQTDESPQSLIVATPNGLPGIPVFSDGNYTDENGQMWVCDEIDFARGKYVQRIGVVDYSNSNAPSVSFGGTKYPTKYRWILAKDNKPEPNPDNVAPILCTVAAAGSANQTYLCKEFISVTGSVITLYLEEIATMNATQATSWMRDRNVKVIYILATPIETDLAAEEIAQYSALHTNYPNTTIYNDEGAGLEVDYVADTKLYIDRRINELTATE